MIHTLGLKCCHEVLRVELVTWCFPGVEGRLVKLDKVLVMVDANRIGHLKQELKEDVGIFDYTVGQLVPDFQKIDGER